MNELFGRIVLTLVVVVLIKFLLDWNSDIIAFVFLAELWFGFAAGMAYQHGRQHD